MTTVQSGKDFLNVIIDDVQDIVKEQSIKVYEGVTRRTPVRTGQTRASWNMTEDVPDFSTIDEGGELGSPLPMPETPRLKLNTDYPVVHVTNGKKHIGFLETGSPTTEATAMVETTLASIS